MRIDYENKFFFVLPSIFLNRAVLFDVVDVGVLFEGWRFERTKPAYCVRFGSAGLKQALASAHPNINMPEGSWRH
ncbi:MAG: hypothetical protein V7L29_17085 [Nostoc sp.]|uniref:hypothetical protein n=1 Tax=Nostoc sp. TaxID=1180 RepID=UPI002FF5761D